MHLSFKSLFYCYLDLYSDTACHARRHQK